MNAVQPAHRDTTSAARPPGNRFDIMAMLDSKAGIPGRCRSLMGRNVPSVGLSHCREPRFSLGLAMAHRLLRRGVGRVLEVKVMRVAANRSWMRRLLLPAFLGAILVAHSAFAGGPGADVYSRAMKLHRSERWDE